MILGKLRDPKMRSLRSVFKTYNIKPEPVFIDFDQRGVSKLRLAHTPRLIQADGDLLEPTLNRLLGTQNEPFVLLKGESLDTKTISQYVSLLSDWNDADVRLESDEKVIAVLGKTGASVAKKLKKNKHQKEEERREMDRILGPAPILDE
jgi:hypothetical protein